MRLNESWQISGKDGKIKQNKNLRKQRQQNKKHKNERVCSTIVVLAEENAFWNLV